MSAFAASGVIAAWLIILGVSALWITAGAIQSRKDRRDEMSDAWGDMVALPDESCPSHVPVDRA